MYNHCCKFVFGKNIIYFSFIIFYILAKLPKSFIYKKL